MGVVIEATNVTKKFGGASDAAVVAIKSANLKIEEGEFVSILGPSGCGKSTLLDIIGGLELPTSGEVFVEGQSVTRPSPKMAMVFQQMSLLPWRSALANVELGLEFRGTDVSKRRDKAMEMIRLVGLAGFEHKYPSQLSGGMCQRMAIARALALDPDILLMDEPFGALDEQTRRLMGLELLRIWEKTGKTVIFVTHSIEEAIQLSDRILLMSARPSIIRDEIMVPLARPRTMESLASEERNTIERRIWHALLEEVGHGNASNLK